MLAHDGVLPVICLETFDRRKRSISVNRRAAPTAPEEPGIQLTTPKARRTILLDGRLDRHSFKRVCLRSRYCGATQQCIIIEKKSVCKHRATYSNQTQNTVCKHRTTPVSLGPNVGSNYYAPPVIVVTTTTTSKNNSVYVAVYDLPSPSRVATIHLFPGRVEYMPTRLWDRQTLGGWYLKPYFGTLGHCWYCRAVPPWCAVGRKKYTAGLSPRKGGGER